MSIIIWKQVEGTQPERPAELEHGYSTVYLRQNIQLVEKEEENGDIVPMWVYQEAAIPKDEYEQHELEIDNELRMCAIEEAQAELLLNQMGIIESQAMQEQAIAELLLHTL